jgi:hypothetical protein
VQLSGANECGGLWTGSSRYLRTFFSLYVEPIQRGIAISRRCRRWAADPGSRTGVRGFAVSFEQSQGELAECRRQDGLEQEVCDFCLGEW